ncbi:MAG: TonB-dependent receptor family protein [Rikenellaceae bacterium]|nr:TonB-dependent receptor family protein [Rikenellaceae bacterium]
MKAKKISALLTIISAMLVCSSIDATAIIADTPGKNLTIVKGRINDTQSGEPEVGAVVQFFKADNLEKPIAYTITDENGDFVHNLDGYGEYVLLFTNVGRKETRKSFTLGGENELDLGTILIEDDIEMLEAGKVVALKDLIKMDVDRISYKVADDIDAKSSTLLDMLRKVPMVTVDAQDKILVNGSSSFQVLVDGKPNVMMSSNPSQVFKALPASFAKDIQVITNPGVKYDAEGVGGVLNITTNKELGASSKDLDGYNANISLGAGNLSRQASAFVTLQKGKLSASGQVSVSESNIPGSSTESVREQLDELGNVVSTNKSVTTSDIKAPIKLASATVGYEINDRNLVSATLGYSTIASHATNSSETSIISQNAMPVNFNMDSKTIWDINSINGGLDYQRTSKKNPNESFVLSYLYSSSPSDTDSETLFGDKLPGLVNRYTDGMTNTVQNTVQADYSTAIESGLGINVGAKYINRLNKSDQSLFFDKNGNWEQDMDGSMIYRHNNDIVAAYAELSYKKDKFSSKGGVRYEHTFQNVNYKLGNGQDFSLNYGNLVPAASLQYNFTPTSNAGLTYNMRISRPGITYLNPYVDIKDPTVKSYGNSKLETERAHNIGLTYNYLSQNVILNANAHFNYTGNAIQQYSFFDNNGVLNTTYGNVARNSSSGVSGMAILNRGVTRVILNAGVNYNDMKSEKLGLHNSGWSANGLASVQTTLPLDLRLSGNMIWTSKMKSLDGWTSGVTIGTLGVSRNFLDDKLSIGATGIMPLNLKLCMERESHSQGADYRQHSIGKIPLAGFTISASWNFGSNKNANVKKARKTISNDDLKDRSNESQGTSALKNL